MNSPLFTGGRSLVNSNPDFRPERQFRSASGAPLLTNADITARHSCVEETHDIETKGHDCDPIEEAVDLILDIPSREKALEEHVRYAVDVLRAIAETRENGHPSSVDCEAQRANFLLPPRAYALLRPFFEEDGTGRLDSAISEVLRQREQPLASHQKLLALRRWASDKLRYEYFPKRSLFLLRMTQTKAHGRTVTYIAQGLRDRALDTLDDEEAKIDVLTNDALVYYESEDEDDEDSEDEGDEDAGEQGASDSNSEDEEATTVFPDASLLYHRGDEVAGEDPGLVLEVGFSHPTPPEQCAKYLKYGKSDTRCVIKVDIEYRTRKQRLANPTPPAIAVTICHLEDKTPDQDGPVESVASLAEEVDPRAAPDRDLGLTLRDVHYSLPARPVPFTMGELVRCVDRAWADQLHQDRKKEERKKGRKKGEKTGAGVRPGGQKRPCIGTGEVLQAQGWAKR